jgi:hypothetical protein
MKRTFLHPINTKSKQKMITSIHFRACLLVSAQIFCVIISNNVINDQVRENGKNAQKCWSNIQIDLV